MSITVYNVKNNVNIMTISSKQFKENVHDLNKLYFDVDTKLCFEIKNLHAFPIMCNIKINGNSIENMDIVKPYRTIFLNSRIMLCNLLNYTITVFIEVDKNTIGTHDLKICNNKEKLHRTNKYYDLQKLQYFEEMNIHHINPNPMSNKRSFCLKQNTDYYFMTNYFFGRTFYLNHISTIV